MLVSTHPLLSGINLLAGLILSSPPFTSPALTSHSAGFPSPFSFHHLVFLLLTLTFLLSLLLISPSLRVNIVLDSDHMFLFASFPYSAPHPLKQPGLLRQCSHAPERKTGSRRRKKRKKERPPVSQESVSQ